jgi:hypothetical protein
MKSLRTFLIIALILFFVSCKKDEENPAKTDIEISGTWSVNGINPQTGGVGAENASMTVTNSVCNIIYSSMGTVTLEILEYDNSNDFFVGEFTAHSASPDVIGKFAKINWQFVDSKNIKLKTYSFEDTQQAAKNSSTVFWGPSINWTKQ